MKLADKLILAEGIIRQESDRAGAVMSLGFTKAIARALVRYCDAIAPNAPREELSPGIAQIAALPEPARSAVVDYVLQYGKLGNGVDSMVSIAEYAAAATAKEGADTGKPQRKRAIAP